MIILCYSDLHSTPPRKLKPISPKKKKRRQPKPRPFMTPPAEPAPGNVPPLMNQDMLSQLRARLEGPDSQPVSSAPSSPVPPLVMLNETTPSHHPDATPSSLEVQAPDIREDGDGLRLAEEKKHRRRRKRREKLERQEHVPLSPQEVGASEDPLSERGDSWLENTTPGIIMSLGHHNYYH